MDRDETYLWLLLSRLAGSRPSSLRRLLCERSDPLKILALPRREWVASGSDAAMLAALEEWRRRGRRSVSGELAGHDQRCLSLIGGVVVPLCRDDYPARLREIHDPPPLLYLRGDPDALVPPQLAIVGSRKGSGSGCRMAGELAGQLAALGFGVCSGLALGIDASAHRGALEVGGVTVAVMATGVDRIYPRQHVKLAEEICGTGVLVSEAPPGAPPQRQRFPRRNRLISGLSLGVVVVEAALRSGSLVTARLALEQDREVFALPHSIHHPLGRGCNRLIAQGARLVQEVADILEELRYIIPAGDLGRGSSTPEVSKQAAGLLDAMGGAPTTVNELALATGRDVDLVLQELGELELLGVVESRGGCYQRL